MRPFQSTICVNEDREAWEPSLRVVLASLGLHCPGRAISLFYPFANESFRRWLSGYPQVRLQADGLRNGYGWNVKPQAILQLLDAGFDEVIWIDSDMFVTRDIHPLFRTLDEAVFVATEASCALDRNDHDGAGRRAQLWQFPVGRVLPWASLNSCVLRVTRRHYPLMKRWWELLQSDAYQRCQQKEWQKRPIHMQGDQDVLTALLTSTEFAHIPLRTLRRGKNIVLSRRVTVHFVCCQIQGGFGMRHELAVRTLQVQYNASIASDATSSAHRPADGRLSRHCPAYETRVRVDVPTKIWHQMICCTYNSLGRVLAVRQPYHINRSSIYEPLLRCGTPACRRRH